MSLLTVALRCCAAPRPASNLQEFVEHIVASTNMRSLSPISALDASCNFLAANLYAKSIFGTCVVSVPFAILCCCEGLRRCELAWCMLLAFAHLPSGLVRCDCDTAMG